MSEQELAPGMTKDQNFRFSILVVMMMFITIMFGIWTVGSLYESKQHADVRITKLKEIITSNETNANVLFADHLKLIEDLQRVDDDHGKALEEANTLGNANKKNVEILMRAFNGLVAQLQKPVAQGGTALQRPKPRQAPSVSTGGRHLQPPIPVPGQ